MKNIPPKRAAVNPENEASTPFVKACTELMELLRRLSSRAWEHLPRHDPSASLETLKKRIETEPEINEELKRRGKPEVKIAAIDYEMAKKRDDEGRWLGLSREEWEKMPPDTAKEDRTEIIKRIKELHLAIHVEAERRGLGDIVPRLPKIPEPMALMLKPVSGRRLPLSHPLMESAKKYDNRESYSKKVNAVGKALELLSRRIYAHDQVAGEATPTSGPGMGGASDGSDVLVTLSEAALIARIPKRSLEKKQLPVPDLPGGKGKAHRWRWSRLRPALELYATRQIPERYPTFIP